MPGLGRLCAPDRRDGRYAAADVLPTPSGRTWRYWHNRWWGDQGRTSRCVGYAWGKYLEDGPVTQPNVPVDDEYCARLYWEAQRNDEWLGQEPDYEGTSVRAGAKVLQARGLLSEYRWAWDLDTVVRTLLDVGPVVVGTNWYRSFFTPDSQGVISVGGPVDGGHAYVLNGVNTARGMVRAGNSWGRDWGREGFFTVPFEVMSRLIVEDGEAALATEVRDGGAR